MASCNIKQLCFVGSPSLRMVFILLVLVASLLLHERNRPYVKDGFQENPQLTSGSLCAGVLCSGRRLNGTTQRQAFWLPRSALWP